MQRQVHCLIYRLVHLPVHQQVYQPVNHQVYQPLHVAWSAGRLQCWRTADSLNSCVPQTVPRSVNNPNLMPPTASTQLQGHRRASKSPPSSQPTSIDESTLGTLASPRTSPPSSVPSNAPTSPLSNEWTSPPSSATMSPPTSQPSSLPTSAYCVECGAS